MRMRQTPLFYYRFNVNQLTALIQTLYHDKFVSFYATMIASNCLKMWAVPISYVCESFLYKHLYSCN